MNTFNYPSLSQQQWQSLKQMIERKFDILISSNKGQATAQGFRFSWTYHTRQETLELTCNEKPVYVPYSMIKHQVDSLVSQL